MKKTLTSLLCSVAMLAQSATYYVDYDGGDDSNTGTSTSAPWKHSPFDANATGNPDITTPAPGDTIQFKAGVRYKGQLTINSSGTAGNHITYKGTGWGTGKAILDGSVLLTNTWTQCTSSAQVYGNPNYANIWFATAAFTNQTGLHQIIQTNEQLRFSQITPVPHAVLFDLTTTWSNVPSANVTLTSLSNSTLFTQSDVDFWRGAYLALHKSPNIVSFEIIEGLNPATDTITNGAQSNLDIYNPSPFEIIGHPLNIDYPGEYAVITNRLWMWPTNNANPNNLELYVGSLDYAISIAGESYITIDGFEITGYYGGLDVTYSGGAIGNTGSGEYEQLYYLNNDIKNCRSMTRGGVLGLDNANRSLVIGNSISDCLRSRGSIFHGTNIVVASNAWVRLGGTGIYFAGVVDGIVRSNYVVGIRGTHGNGISVYQGSQDCIVDRNYLAECGSPITYERGSNYLFSANFVDCSYGGIDEWGGMVGKVQWFNNTIVNMPGSVSSLNLGKGTSNSVYLVNNLVDGVSWQSDPNIVMRSHNIWLDYDRGYAAPTMGTGESINTNWASIFVDTNAATANWRLLSSSPALNAGTNVSPFGVTLDMDGATLDSSPDMGAWQYLNAIVTNNASGARVMGFRGLGMSVLPPPVSPYLLEQDFEGTGYDNSQTWAEVGSGTLNEDYTSTVLVGSQSMLIDLTSNIGDTASPIITMPSGGGDIWYVYFQLRVLTFPSSGFRVATVTNSFDLSINASSNLVIRPQVGTGVATVGKLEAGVTYHVWMQGSGNDVETSSAGTARVGFSTTGIRPTSGDNYAIDTDVSANGPFTGIQLILGTRQIGANYSVIIDKVRVDNDLIGDNPQ